MTTIRTTHMRYSTGWWRRDRDGIDREIAACWLDATSGHWQWIFHDGQYVPEVVKTGASPVRKVASRACRRAIARHLPGARFELARADEIHTMRQGVLA